MYEIGPTSVKANPMSKTLTAVIVDDSPIVRARLITLLAQYEWITVVGQAEDVYDALDVIRRSGPDIVILDLQLKTGSGLTVLRELQSMPAKPTVIMLTNHASDYMRATCSMTGADFFFDKSTEFDGLVEVCLALRGN